MGIFDKGKKKVKGGTSKNNDARDKRHRKQATDKTPMKTGSVLKKDDKKKGTPNKDNSARNKRHKKQATSKKPMKTGSVIEKRTPEEKAAAKLKRQTKRGKAPGQTTPYSKKGPVKKKMDSSAAANQLKELGKPSSKGYEKKGPVKKTVARVARDYAANAAYDAQHGYNKEAEYEKKKLGSILSKHMHRNR